MDEVRDMLSNPLMRNGLKIVAPQLFFVVDAVVTTFFQQKLKTDRMVKIIDQRLAKVLQDLASTSSKRYQQECEIRAHELLTVLHEYGRL